MADGFRILIEGENEFRAALRRADRQSFPQAQKALRSVGRLIVVRIRSFVARRTGKLAGGYRVEVRGLVGYIKNLVPYAGGADWGRKGKWSGFAGSPPRYAGKTVEEMGPEIMREIERELKDVVHVYGWFR